MKKYVCLLQGLSRAVMPAKAGIQSKPCQLNASERSETRIPALGLLNIPVSDVPHCSHGFKLTESFVLCLRWHDID